MTTLLDRYRIQLTRADAIRVLASFVLAVLLWGWVTTEQDPEIEKSFSNITLTAPTLPENLKIVSQIPTVTVRLVGPRSVLDSVGLSDVSVSLKTGEISQPGTYTVGVAVSTPRGVRQRTPTPTRVEIVVEETASKQVPLTFLPPTLPDNDSRQVGELNPSVSEVTVSGAKSAVDRVARVAVAVDIGDRTRDFEGDFTPVAQDAKGVAIPEVQLTPATIRVVVPISQRGRGVAVITNLTGEPAAGYEVVARTVNPPTVLVDGPAAALAQLISVSTEPVDISGATATVSRQVKLDVGTLPAGVIVLQPATGIVDVVVQIGQRGVTQTLPAQTLTVVGLSPGLTATVTPDQVGVVIVATQGQLTNLHSGDIQIRVDVSGVGPGSYTLTPSVAVPPNVRWLQTDPPTVSVVIAPFATPAPASPAASPGASPVAVATAPG